MIIELLYPRISNLFGESGHARYLRQLFPEARFIETGLKDEPAFVKQDVQLVYMGGATERNQEKIISALLPWRAAVLERIEGDMNFLLTGNALELVGQYIDDGSGKKIAALDIFPFYAKRRMQERLHDYYVGELVLAGRYKDAPAQLITGFKTQFSQAYPLGELPAFCRTRKGFGMNQSVAEEGIAYKGFLASYLVGPLLLLNPQFTRTWLQGMGQGDRALPLEAAMREAYDARLKHFLDVKTRIN